jgi:hypothetical protein
MYSVDKPLRNAATMPDLLGRLMPGDRPKPVAGRRHALHDHRLVGFQVRS